jgi:hypothetical protein
MVKALGGISAIAISHPHYYSSMVEWSRAFGGVPIHLHAADRQWVMRPDETIDFWGGAMKPLGDGLTLVRCGVSVAVTSTAARFCTGLVGRMAKEHC